MAYIVKITDDVPQLKNRVAVAASSENYQQDDYVDPFSIANFGTYNVATFEMEGIDLHSTTNKTYADTDSIGFIADEVTDGSGEISSDLPTFNFLVKGSNTPWDITGTQFPKGVMLNFWRPVEYLVYTMRVYESYQWDEHDVPYGENLLYEYIDREATAGDEITGDGMHLFLNPSDFKHYDDLVRYVEMEFSFVRQSDANAFFGIASVDFGQDYNVSVLDNSLEISAEISLDFDDIPIGTFAATVKTPSTLYTPTEGQRVVITTDFFNNKYYIDKVTQIGPQIYQITGFDDIGRLDTELADGTSVVNISNSTDMSYYLSNTGVIWSERPTTSVYGFFKGKTTSRQALSMYALATGQYISAWNDTIGIHGTAPANLQEWTAGNDKVFYKAEHREVEKHRTVVLQYLSHPEKENNALVQVVCPNYGYATDAVGVDHSQCGNLNTQAGPATAEDTPSTAYVNNETAQATRIAAVQNGDEVAALIIYEGEAPGDIITITLPYNLPGTSTKQFTGRIREMSLSMSKNSTIASIVVKGVG